MDQSAKPIFNFVNLSHPDELKDEETQLRIRRLAMSEVGRARRKPKTKRERNEIILEFRKPVETSTTIGRLGGGEVDPFAPYPIDLNETSRALIASIFRENSVHARQLRGSWYAVGLSDKSAFYNVLANARLYQLRELTGTFVQKDDSVSLSMQRNALRAMSQKMKDPQHHASDEMIGSVSSFMCHHYILGAFTGWEYHRNALSRMITLRGGINGITNESLRITISWTDLVGSFSQDLPSFLPLPQLWQSNSQSPPASPRFHSPISLLWKYRFPTTNNWITIFDDIRHLILLDRGLTSSQRHLAHTTGSWMEPTMVRLLSLRPLAQGTAAENIMEEVCRLGTMLFLAPIWRWLGASPVWTFKLTRNLLATLQGYVVEWGELKPLLVWAVYFGAIETRDAGERSQFAFFLAVLMGGMGMREWEEVMGVVKGVLWVEGVFAGWEGAVREEVLRILRGPTREMTPVLEEIGGEA